MPQPRVRRVGVLTGGGDCPGLNAAIRAVVKSAAGQGIQVIGIQDGFAGLIEPSRTRVLTPWEVRGILTRGGTMLGASNRTNPFRYPVEVEGQALVVDRSDLVLRHIEELELDGLVAVGGDGSLKIALELHRRGAPIVGVPKTIDNDLGGTDVSIGFNTAVATATDALDRLHTTAESHHRVMVIEVMGRHAGWIAIEAGLAGGADSILIPEIPFNVELVCHRIEQRVRDGSLFSLVMVAEGAHPVGGIPSIQQDVDRYQTLRLGGIGQSVASMVGRCTAQEVRWLMLGHLLRGGPPTPYDRALATCLGSTAVDLIVEGKFGRMAGVRGADIVAVTLEEATTEPHLVPLDGAQVRVARRLGICLGD